MNDLDEDVNTTQARLDAVQKKMMQVFKKAKSNHQVRTDGRLQSDDCKHEPTGLGVCPSVVWHALRCMHARASERAYKCVCAVNTCLAFVY